MGKLLQDKVVIVTGGAGLIGTVFVQAILNEGGIGIVADVNEEAGNKFVRLLSDKGYSDKVHFAHIDIVSKESIHENTEILLKKYGKIDALVNNAYPRNKNYGRVFEQVTYEDFCANVGMHLGGYFVMSQQLSEIFKKQRNGTIINISSIYGVIAPKFEIYSGTTMTMPVEYAVIKSGLIHLTKYMAKYFKGYNIRVNAISPGGIFHNQDNNFVERYNANTLSKGMLNGTDLTGTLIYLLSDLSLYVNGQNLIVDDGFSL